MKQIKSLSLFSRSIIILIALTSSAVDRLGAQTTLLDTVTNATNFTFTGSTPRTYMGDGFTNLNLPVGTTSFDITSLTLYMVSATTTSYTDIVARIQLWNTYNPAGASVFSSAAGPLLTIDLGAFTTAANTFYSIPITLGTPITLSGGPGTNWGFAQNFQGNTGSGLIDTTNLTSLITYNTGTSGYAAGTITTGTPPIFGYYRNASGRTDFNFANTDVRSLATTGANYQGIAIIISGTAVPEPSTYLMVLGGAGILLLLMRVRRAR